MPGVGVMAETISAATGLPLRAAARLLAAHNGDANAAVNEYLNSQNVDFGTGRAGSTVGSHSSESLSRNGGSEGAEDEESASATDRVDRNRATSGATASRTRPDDAEESSADAIERLFNSAKLKTDDDSINRHPGGRRLGTEKSSLPSSSLPSDAPEEIHIAFFRHCIVFFSEDSSKKASSRRGVHTFQSTLGPYEKYPYLHWIGSMTEVYRAVDNESVEYKRLLSDLRANRVPNLPFFRQLKRPKGTDPSRPSVSFILHDHRQQEAPPQFSSSSSKYFTGSGSTLGGTASKQITRHSHGEQKALRNGNPIRIVQTCVVLGFSVGFPLVCNSAGLEVNLFHAIVGAIVGAMIMHWWPVPSSPQAFALNNDLPTTQLKFRVKGRQLLTNQSSTFRLTFNQDVHSLKEIYDAVANHFVESEMASWQGRSFDLFTDYPRKLLDPKDDKTTLSDANLLQANVTIMFHHEDS